MCRSETFPHMWDACGVVRVASEGAAGLEFFEGGGGVMSFRCGADGDSK